MNSDYWHHAPLHALSESGTYFVTAATLHKQHLFKGKECLQMLQERLLECAQIHKWQIDAWAVFPNHYHFIGHSPGDEENALGLRTFLGQLHQNTASWLNQRDGCIGREVWYNFWETRLTFLKSYLARLNYVHQNPVRHGLVPVANQYPYCSAGWFESRATRSQIRTVYSFKAERLSLPDDYEVCADWQ